MVLSNNNGKKILLEYYDCHEYDLFYKLCETFRWYDEVYINGKAQGITYGELNANLYENMPKRYIKKIASFRKAIFMAKFPKGFGVFDDNALSKKRRIQASRILQSLGDKPFEQPQSIWESQVNEGRVVKKDNPIVEYFKNCDVFEVLPYPMYFGMYDKDYQEVLISIK